MNAYVTSTGAVIRTGNVSKSIPKISKPSQTNGPLLRQTAPGNWSGAVEKLRVKLARE